jgi:hypothetical protein
MKPIPLFLHEEHHEAFLIWHYAIQRGLLPAQQNVLLHVDSHSDMGQPLLRTAIHQFPHTLADIAQFTYNELNIGTFILPAIYQGIFQTIYWLQPKAGKLQTAQKYVRTHKQAGQYFIVGPDFSPWPHNKPWQDRVCFTQHVISLETPVPAMPSVVLDIDLDFFSCEFFIDAAAKVEITPQEAERFQQNRYHPLRLHNHCMLEVHDHRFYLVLNVNSGGQIETSAKLSEEAIVQRIDRFGAFLRDNKITPTLIDVCRSRFSGYTPGDQWEWIEQRLCAKLRELYAIAPRYIDELCSTVTAPSGHRGGHGEECPGAVAFLRQAQDDASPK